MRNINDSKLKTDNKTFKGHVKASSKATLPTDSKQNAQAISIHNHAKSMHQLEKIIGQNTK